jgi:multiple sugar transport system permease protein
MATLPPDTVLSAKGAPAQQHSSPAPRHGLRFSQRAANIATVVGLILGGLFVLLPVFWILDTAFKPQADAFVVPPKFIYTPTLGNFRAIISGPYNAYFADMGHSLVIMLISVGVALFLGVPAGYGLARSRFRGSGAITGWLIVAYIVPALVYIVPLLAIYVKLGIDESYLAIILYYETFLLPFVVFMMRGYFTDVPHELEDAARVDGCSRFQAFQRVIVPLVWPGISTVTILACILSWGEFFGALIFTGSQTMTAPVAIDQYMGQTTSNWSYLAAAALFLVVPVLVLTGFVQRGFLRTVTSATTG